MNPVGFDIETTCLNGWAEGARVISAATYPAWDVFGGVYAFHHPGMSEAWREDGDEVLDEEESIFDFVRVFGSPEYTSTVVGHNLFFDVSFWEARMPGRIRCELFDTMVAHALIDENAPNSLGDVAQKYLGVGKVEGLDRRKLLDYSLDEVLEYNRMDAELAYRLYEPLREELEREGLLDSFNLRMRALRHLIDMHHNGVDVDQEMLGYQLAVAEQRMHEIEDAIEEMHPGLNIRSPAQLVGVIYGHYGLPELGSTASGQPKTDKQTLDALAQQDHANAEAVEFIELLTEHRSTAKLHGTYLCPIVEHIGRDGRIHPTYHVSRGQDYGMQKGKGKSWSFGTVTGRLSSSNPNFQNIAKDERVRSVFVPTDGWRLLDADYAQVEVRIAAWLSQDPELLRMIRGGRDYHCHTLANVEGKSYEDTVALCANEVQWKEKRDAIKRVNFGMLYGAYPTTIKAQVESAGVPTTLGQVQRMWNGWKRTYVGFVAWESVMHRRAKENGFVESPIGGRRRFDLESSDLSRVSRQASNYLIQGTAADIMLMGLCALAEAIQGRNAKLVATVHDSVTLEYDPTCWTEADLVDVVEDSLVHKPLKAMSHLPRIEDLILAVDVELDKERWLK